MPTEPSQEVHHPDEALPSADLAAHFDVFSAEADESCRHPALPEIAALRNALDMGISEGTGATVEILPTPLRAQQSLTSDEVSREPPSLERVVEAICFVEGRPVSTKRLAEIVPGVPEEEFERVVAQLNRRYREQGRPYGFVRQNDGYLLTLRPQYRLLIQRLYSETKEATLSLSAIEVLAIIAYKQPVARSTIDALRGRDSAGVIRQLLRRGLIAVYSGEMTNPAQPIPNTPSNSQQEATSSNASAAFESGIGSPSESSPEGNTDTASLSRRIRRENYYVTTPRFLALFNLRDLSELPRTDDLEIL